MAAEPALLDDQAIDGLRTYDELQALEYRPGRPLIIAIVWRGAAMTEAATTTPAVAAAIHREATRT